MFCAKLGPVLVSVTVNLTFSPTVGAVLSTVLTKFRSALGPTVEVIVLLLLPGVGSLVLLETVAVFAMLEPKKSLGTLYVTVIVLVVFGAITPRLHGKVVVQAPVLETKVNPVGVGSST